MIRLLVIFGHICFISLLVEYLIKMYKVTVCFLGFYMVIVEA